MKLAIVGTRNPGVTYQEWENVVSLKMGHHFANFAS